MSHYELEETVTRCEWCGREGTAVHDPDTGTYTCRYCGGARTRSAAPRAPSGQDGDHYDVVLENLRKAAEREEALREYRRRYGSDYDDGNETAFGIFIGVVLGLVVAVLYLAIAGRAGLI